MRLSLICVFLLISGCSSVRKHEEITTEALEAYQTDSVTYHVNSWVPIESAGDIKVSELMQEESAADQELCINEYRGQNFEDEPRSVLFFMQCMNSKGWRLETEEVFVLSHEKL